MGASRISENESNVRESNWSGVEIMENKLKIGLGIAKAAVLLALMAVTNGCHQPTQVEAKSPTPVHLAEVALDSSSEDLRYSASVLPFAQASLSFKSAGYVTEIKQVVGADGRRRDVGPGDYVSRGSVLAQIRHQDLKNQLDQAMWKQRRITSARRRFTPHRA
jgi:multidrug efflux system membrane fusion protein